MNSHTPEFVFCTLTRAIMTMLFCGAVYLLRVTARMIVTPASALRLYHSFPLLAEHILAGILVYAAVSLLFFRAAAQKSV